MSKLKPSFRRIDSMGCVVVTAIALHRCDLGSSFGLHALCETGLEPRSQSFSAISNATSHVKLVGTRVARTVLRTKLFNRFVVSLFPLLLEDFDRVLRFSPLVINQLFQFQLMLRYGR